MKTANHISKATHSGLFAGGAMLLMLGTMGFAGTAHARDNISFSVGMGVPGVVVGVSNAYPVYSQPVYSQPIYSQPVYAQPVYAQPVYPQPVYARPQPIYIQPQPVHVRSRSVYVRPAAVYVQSAPVYYASPQVYHERRPGHGHLDGGYYVPAPRPGHGPGFSGQRYAPVYYQR